MCHRIDLPTSGSLSLGLLRPPLCCSSRLACRSRTADTPAATRYFLHNILSRLGDLATNRSLRDRALRCVSRSACGKYPVLLQRPAGTAARSKKKIARLPVIEFIDRFLQHVLPRGKRHVRDYGYLSPGRRAESLKIIRELFHMEAKQEEDEVNSHRERTRADETEGRVVRANLSTLRKRRDDGFRCRNPPTKCTRS